MIAEWICQKSHAETSAGAKGGAANGKLYSDARIRSPVAGQGGSGWGFMGEPGIVVLGAGRQDHRAEEQKREEVE